MHFVLGALKSWSQSIFSRLPPVKKLLFAPKMLSAVTPGRPAPLGIDINDQDKTASGDSGAPGSVWGDGGGAFPVVEYAHGEEAEKAQAGDVRELFHTPVLRKVTLCL